METTVPHCFSVAAAAEAAGVSAWLIWKMIRLGKLRARKLGRRTVITIDDFRAWLDGAAVEQREPQQDRASQRPRVSRFGKILPPS